MDDLKHIVGMMERYAQLEARRLLKKQRHFSCDDKTAKRRLDAIRPILAVCRAMCEAGASYDDPIVIAVLRAITTEFERIMESESWK